MRGMDSELEGVEAMVAGVKSKGVSHARFETVSNID